MAAAPPAAPAVPPSASLYVGDLATDVTEAQLYEIFAAIGPVASIRVCRDAVTRRSLGYAYVNFNSAADETAAERALEALNYTPVNGKPIRIMGSQRDPALRKSNIGNIFIKNLKPTIDARGLYELFEDYGTILSCKVSTDPDGKSKGYGFVQYETSESANVAIEKTNGVELEGQKIFVGHFVRKAERPSDGAEPRFTNVFVKNLDPEASEDDVRAKFAAHGEVANVIVMKDADGKSKGFGFVNFSKPEEAAAAVAALHGADYRGKALFCGRAQKKSERDAMLRHRFEEMRNERQAKYQGVNLYVKNLDDGVDDDKLREEFATVGTITSAKVMRDDKGVSKGFGFVCYSSPEEATKAVTELNGKMVANKPVYVALAQRKDVRRAQLSMQHQQRDMMAMGGMALRGPQGMPLPGGQGGFVYPGGAGMYGPPGAMGPPGVPQRGPGGMMYAVPPQMQQRAFRGPMAPMGLPTAQMGRPGGYPVMGGPGGYPMMMPPQPGGRGQGPMQAGPRGIAAGRGGRGMGGVPQGMVPPGAMPGMPPMGMVKGPMVAAPRGPTAGRPMAAPAGGKYPNGAPMPRPAAGADSLASQLASMAPADQKQTLGEKLFPLVQRQRPELAGKITGMLLEMDNPELLILLESQEALNLKVEEAIAVLAQHAVLPLDGAGEGVAA